MVAVTPEDVVADAEPALVRSGAGSADVGG
jgi:hypothetical protein